MQHLRFVTSLLTLSIISWGASAAVIYNNPPSNTDNANCAFSTTCTGDVYAAQRFTVLLGVDITTVDYTIVQFLASETPSSTNWAFDEANGAGGSPGTVVASGLAGLTTANGSFGCGTFTCYNYVVNVGNVLLAPGNYYLALQDVSTHFNNYLHEGTDPIQHAYESQTGIAGPWSLTYEGITNVSVSVEGTTARVPEPASLSLLGLGLAGLGFSRRRKSN